MVLPSVLPKVLSNDWGWELTFKSPFESLLFVQENAKKLLKYR